MANVNLQYLLGAPNLCGIIQTTKSIVPDPFDAPAYDYVDKVCNGNTGQYTTYAGVRKLTRVSAYGGASGNMQLRELGIKPVVLVHSNNNIIIQPTDYMSILAYDDLVRQKLGIQEVTRQVMATRDYSVNFRRVMKSAMLFNNGFTWDSQGNMIPPGGSGAVNTTGVNYGVPSGNQGQLDILGTGNPIIATTWNNPAAKIPEQLSQLVKQSTQLTGYTTDTAYYGANIAQFMTQNNYVQPFLARAQLGALAPGMEFVSDGTLPPHLLGFDWIPAYMSYWRDQNDVAQTFVGDDAVTFTPKPESFWVACLEGTIPVPTKANIITQYETSLQDAGMIEQAGMFAYGVQTVDPAGLKIVFGDTYLPILKVPNAIFIATVATGS